MATSPDDDAIDAIERSLVALRRSMSRRALGQELVQAVGGEIDLRVLETLDAVSIGPSEAGDCTVGDVAERLALDPSQASRAVAQAVDVGLVHRVPSQQDARRVHLELTPAGHEVEDRMREVRRAHARARTADWPPEEVVAFGRAFARFTGADEGAG